MAKDKEDKTSTAVLQYLLAQNRPYAINDLLQSSQLKDLGKSAVQKSLDQLVVVLQLCNFSCVTLVNSSSVIGRESERKSVW